MSRFSISDNGYIVVTTHPVRLSDRILYGAWQR
jgi:hypothetical protein